MCDEYSYIADLLHDLADNREERKDCVNRLVLDGTLDLNRYDSLLQIRIQILLNTKAELLENRD